jgi:hypothetical protein
METEQNLPGEEAPVHQIAEYHDDIRNIELEGYELGVKKARNALFIAGGLILVSEAIGYIRAIDEFEPIGFAIIGAIVAVFIGLGLWTKKKPYTAIILGLVAFILYIALVAVVNGYLDGAEGAIKGLFGGFLFKIFILVALIRPLKDAKELQQAKEEKKF